TARTAGGAARQRIGSRCRWVLGRDDGSVVGHGAAGRLVVTATRAVPRRRVVAPHRLPGGSVPVVGYVDGAFACRFVDRATQRCTPLDRAVPPLFGVLW